MGDDGERERREGERRAGEENMEGEGESEAKVRVRARAGESDRSIDRAGERARECALHN